jgi:hypothetical protein
MISWKRSPTLWSRQEMRLLDLERYRTLFGFLLKGRCLLTSRNKHGPKSYKTNSTKFIVLNYLDSYWEFTDAAKEMRGRYPVIQRSKSIQVYATYGRAKHKSISTLCPQSNRFGSGLS